MNNNVLCIFCSHSVSEKNGTICGKAPWEDSNSHHGYHWACENRAEEEQEIMEFSELSWAESKYRGPGMW